MQWSPRQRTADDDDDDVDDVSDEVDDDVSDDDVVETENKRNRYVTADSDDDTASLRLGTIIDII